MTAQSFLGHLFGYDEGTQPAGARFIWPGRDGCGPVSSDITETHISSVSQSFAIDWESGASGGVPTGVRPHEPACACV